MHGLAAVAAEQMGSTSAVALHRSGVDQHMGPIATSSAAEYHISSVDHNVEGVCIGIQSHSNRCNRLAGYTVLLCPCAAQRYCPNSSTSARNRSITSSGLLSCRRGVAANTAAATGL
jgi:hypothetical protein